VVGPTDPATVAWRGPTVAPSGGGSILSSAPKEMTQSERVFAAMMAQFFAVTTSASWFQRALAVSVTALGTTLH
jgi:hypothetical protein